MATSPVPLFRHVQRTMREPEEFREAVSGMDLHIEFLRRNAIPARVEQFQTLGWAFDFGELDVKARVQGVIPPGWVSLALFRGSGASSWHGLARETGTLAHCPPGETLDGLVLPGFAWLSVNVPMTVWNLARELAGAQAQTDIRTFAAWPLGAELVRIERQLRDTQRLLRAATTTPALAVGAIRAAADFATRVVTTAWECAGPDRPLRMSTKNRARLARRADSWLRERSGETFGVLELCNALRVSRRELEYAFRGTFDTSPHNYLNKLRLNAVRRTLLDPAVPVARIAALALDHGFRHLSRFAAEYRALFGETPSETLRRERNLTS